MTPIFILIRRPMLRLLQFLTPLFASSKFGIEIRALSKVRMVEARKPISTTVPFISFVSIQSPCLKTSPKRIEIEPKTLAILSLAANATAAPAIPRPERSAVRFTPIIFKIAMIAMRMSRALVTLMARLITSFVSN